MALFPCRRTNGGSQGSKRWWDHQTPNTHQTSCKKQGNLYCGKPLRFGVCKLEQLVSDTLTMQHVEHMAQCLAQHWGVNVQEHLDLPGKGTAGGWNCLSKWMAKVCLKTVTWQGWRTGFLEARGHRCGEKGGCSHIIEGPEYQAKELGGCSTNNGELLKLWELCYCCLEKEVQSCNLGVFLFVSLQNRQGGNQWSCIGEHDTAVGTCGPAAHPHTCHVDQGSQWSHLK